MRWCLVCLGLGSQLKPGLMAAVIRVELVEFITRQTASSSILYHI